MKRFFLSSEDIIRHVQLLLLIAGLIAVGIISLIFWQLYQNDKTNEIIVNYHNASSQQLNTIRYEIMMIQVNLNKENTGTILPSLHIINKSSSKLFSIQDKYQQSRFNRPLSQLRAQLMPLLVLIEAQQNIQQYILSYNFDAVLLILRQLERLHNINNKSITEKAIKTAKNRIIIMLGIFLGIILIGSLLARKTFNAITRTLKSEKLSIQKLAEEKKRIHTTLNSIGDAVITTDINGRVTSMNPIAEQLTGWLLKDASEKYLKTIFPIIDAPSRKPIENPVDKVIKTGETIYLSNDATLISKDKSEYQIADTAAPIRDEDGEIQGVVLVFNDITEQYLLRQAAAKNKRDLQAILDHSPAVVYVNDTQGRFTFINNKFEKIYNIKSEDIIGKTLQDIFSDDIADEIQKNDKKVLEAGYALEFEETVPHEDGSYTYSSIKFPLFNDDGAIYAVCGISTDITVRKQQNEQLRRSQKMDALGKLTGGIAHDFNNMLGVVLGYAEILESMMADKPEFLNYINEITHAGERGAKMTQKLLSFSKQKTSDSEILNLNAVLQDEQHMLEKTLTARVKLNFDLQDDIWLVNLDAGEFEDAIVNMSINAMHAIDGIGELTIHLRNTTLNETDATVLQIEFGDYVLLSVTDTGSGMDEQTREKIFEPFYSTKGDLGTGLGLSQVYGFVERCKGAIKVFSEEGLGTRITLYFPRYLDTTEVKEIKANNDLLGQKEAASNKNLRGNETILIVDDEVILRKLASEIISQQGYKTLSAESGKQALELLEQEEVDLLFSDVIMPEMDGYELAAIVKEKYPSVKIQLASGFSDERHVNMNGDVLHKNLLHKPYHSTTLLMRMRELLD